MGFFSSKMHWPVTRCKNPIFAAKFDFAAKIKGKFSNDRTRCKKIATPLFPIFFAARVVFAARLWFCSEIFFTFFFS